MYLYKEIRIWFCYYSSYVDDINIIGIPEEIKQSVEYLKKEFKMKELGKMNYCLGWKLNINKMVILVYQSTYIEKLLKNIQSR